MASLLTRVATLKGEHEREVHQLTTQLHTTRRALERTTAQVGQHNEENRRLRAEKESAAKELRVTRRVLDRVNGERKQIEEQVSPLPCLDTVQLSRAQQKGKVFMYGAKRLRHQERQVTEKK